MTNRTAALSAALAGVAILAQAQAQPKLEFEVASVKQNKSGDRRMGLQFQAGKLQVLNLPLHIIIGTAYDVPFFNLQASRITGGPDWTRSDRFDIEGKLPALPEGLTAREREQKVHEMLRALLADRFKLSVRKETKEMPVYAIVAGKNGPKFKAASIGEKDCVADDPQQSDKMCHIFNGGQGRGLHGNAVDMEDLALFVANWTDRPLVNRTGIKGLYKIETDGWAAIAPQQAPAADAKGEDGKLLADRLSIFEVFEKLGLKLEPQRAPIDTYTIERVEHPSEN
jgi:uncharacterized protein (TIGR03435 family)